MVRRIEDESFRYALSGLNPWHETGEIGRDRVPPVERRLAQLLWRRLLGEGLRRYQMIQGPRRVGKSTVLQQTIRRLLASGVEPGRIWWLQMDHPDIKRHDLRAAMEHVIAVSGAAAERPTYVMIDEVARAEQWPLWLKTFYDDSWPVEILATASSIEKLRGARMESGIGRWDEQCLLPCSFSEFIELCPLPSQHTPPERPATTERLSETIEALAPAAYASRELDEARDILMLIGGWPDLLLQARAELDALAPQASHREARARSRAGCAAGSPLPGRRVRRQRAPRPGQTPKRCRRSGDLPRHPRVRRSGRPRAAQGLASYSRGPGGRRHVAGEDLPDSRGVPTDGPPVQPPARELLSHLRTPELLRERAGGAADAGRRCTSGTVPSGAQCYRGQLPRSPAPASTDNYSRTSRRARCAHSAKRRRRGSTTGGEAPTRWTSSTTTGTTPSHLKSPPRRDIPEPGSEHSRNRTGQFRGRCYVVAPDAELIPPRHNDDGIGSIPFNAFLIGVGAQTQLAAENHVGLPHYRPAVDPGGLG